MITKGQIKLVKQLEQKKFRRREGLFVAEGPKVVGDLTAAGFRPHILFSTVPQEGAVTVSDDELRKLSFLQHPQQTLALFPLPAEQAATTPKGLCLALDGVQDPGNLGTIIRIADWFGIDTIYCSPDTADAWAPKVVQATMGSIARVPIIYTDLCCLLDATPLPVYGTLLDGQDIYAQPLTKEAVIVMGNEGKGISEAVRAHVTHRLLIPSYHRGNTAESLNVAIATAITCAEFRRRN
jgi:TrmH family RNA methyltransferase